MLIHKATKALKLLEKFDISIKPVLGAARDWLDKKLWASIRITQDCDVAPAFTEWLTRLDYSKKASQVRAASTAGKPALPTVGNHMFTWREKLLLLSIEEESVGSWGAKNITSTIRILGGSRQDIDDLLTEMRGCFNSGHADKIPIYGNPSGYWGRLAIKDPRPLNTLYYEEGLVEEILGEVKGFFAAKEQYAKRGIPWRRGFLIHGEPGNGKTTLVLGIATQMNMPIYSLSSRVGSKFNEAISQIPSKSILLIEEIDTFVTNRVKDKNSRTSNLDDDEDEENEVQMTDKQLLAEFLNSLDGLCSAEGIVIFATTNYVSRLDKALTRTGRFDRQYELKNCTPEVAGRLFKSSFSDKDSSAFSKRFEKLDKSVSDAQEMISRLINEEEIKHLKKLAKPVPRTRTPKSSPTPKPANKAAAKPVSKRKKASAS